MRYRDSGVDIDKANEATRRIRLSVRKTWSDAVLSDVGHFGGLFRMPDGITDPVLVSSMDGVGTKLLVASRARRFDTVGQDLVNHCVNDILVQGARPLFFLDYVAAARLDPDVVAGVVEGLSVACAENGCALIGGETAEMPGVYHGDDFDLAGTIVGIVSRGAIIDGTTIEPGDTLFALPSNGLHTNGYSLARRIVFDHLGLCPEDHVDELGCTVGEELLRVHRSYLRSVQELQKHVTIRGLAHITGGGLLENLPRVLPEGCGAVVKRGAWEIPPVFQWLAREGDVEELEMFRVFNQGLGMVIAVRAADAATVPGQLSGHTVHRIGEVVTGESRVELV